MANKLKIVLSDLHLNAGFHNEGNRLENFTADLEFARLLEEVQRESDQTQQEVELILNGDFFDFLRVPAVDDFVPGKIYPAETYRDSSVEASIKRLKLIAKGHPLVFAALTDFMHVENPLRRITIIKGNHDINLYWPEVKAKVREILGATGTRSSLLLFAEEFINRENIYIEHGHQYTERMNIYPNFRTPINKVDPTQLYYPPGSHFLINCLDRQAGDRWWLNHILPPTCLIWYALKWDFDFAAQIITYLTQTMPDLLTAEVEPSFNGSLKQMLHQFENQAERATLAKDYTLKPECRENLHQLLQHLTRQISVSEAFNPLSGQGISADPLEMVQAEQEAAQNSLKSHADDLAQQGKAQVFLFGHTHRPTFAELASGGYYINTGCWHWHQHLTPVSDSTWETCLKQRRSMAQPPQFPYARIDYDHEGQPYPQLIDYSGQKVTWQSPKIAAGKLKIEDGRL